MSNATNPVFPKIKIAQAAKLAGKTQQYIRIAMQRNLIDIGVAMKMPGANKYYYDIRPQTLAEYLGVSLEEMYKALEK